MTNILYIIRRAVLILCMMATATMAWAVDVKTAEELKTAINGSETSIKVTSNIPLTETIVINRNITLDLDGHTISANGFRAFHITGGNVTITSTTPATISAGGSIADNSSVIRVGDSMDDSKSDVSLTINENITVTTDKCYGITVFGSTTTETLTVNGHVSTTQASAISGNGTAGYGNTTITIGEKAEITTDNDVAIYHPQSGILTVNGTVRGAGGIEMKGGQLVVSNTAKITATATPSHTGNNNGTSTRGYAISIVENGLYAGVSTINVSNYATITGAVAMVKDSDKADPSAPDPIFDGGGMQMKVKVTDSSSKITGQYLYLEDAIREASSGSTITLLADCDIKSTQETSKDFTLDLDGHTLTSDGQCALWIKKGYVTIKSTAANGQIIVPTISDHDAAAIRVGSDETASASLTVAQNVTVAANECYGISVYGNNTTKALTVNGAVNTNIRPAISSNKETSATTITIASTAQIKSTNAVAIYYPQNGTLNVNGTVTGAGGIEIKAGTLVVDDGAHITANGTPSHVANNDAPSSSGYSIAIVENNTGSGVTAITVPNGATITGPMALLQDSEIPSFNPTLTGSRLTTVASIEKDKYFTLKDAIDIVPSTGTVKLLRNLTLNTTLDMDKEKTYTLDLAGNNLKGSSCAPIHIKRGNITIANSEAAESTISVSGGTPQAVILFGDNEGTNRNTTLRINNNVVVDGGSTASGILLSGDKTRESLYVSGKVTATGHSAIIGNDATNLIQIETTGIISSTNTVAIYHPQSGNLVINGTVQSSVQDPGTSAGAIEMKGGNLTVNNGATITAVGTPTHNASDSAPSTNGYAIALVENKNFTGVGKVNISNGASVTGVIACLVDSRNVNVAETRFTGDIQMVAETKMTDGHGDKYSTLANAIDAATSGEVKLLENLTLSEAITIDKAITLNLDDYTLTGNQSSGSTITISGSATIQNGGIVSNKGVVSITSGDVTLQQLTIETQGEGLNISGGTVTIDQSTSITSTANNTIAISGGDLTLNGKVYNTSTSANHAIAATGSAALTVATTAVISSANSNGINWGSTGALTVNGGKVSGAEAINATNGTVTIEGGTFTGTGHAVNFGSCTPTVNAGTFICGSTESYKPIVSSTANGFVYGDYFSKEIDQTLCASGYMVSANPRSNGMYYLVNEIVINDGTNWTPPTTEFTIGTARYVRNSGMGAHGTQFGTLCLPFSFAYNVVSGMTFYNVNRIEDNVLYLDAITSGNIPAGTPVVFQFTSATTSFTIESHDAPISKADAGNNDSKLFGTFTKKDLTTITGPVVSAVYYLNSDAFHQASETLTIPAFRAYIKVTPTSPSPAHPRMLRIVTDDDMTTAIDSPLEDAELESIYDVQGRKQNGLQHGMNIMRTKNGRTIKVYVNKL